MKNSIVHFEIPADDVNRAQEFYKNAFGWKINKFDMPNGQEYFGVTTTELDENNMSKTPGAINGGLMKRVSPGQPFMNYISVDSIEAALKDVVANGGIIAMPKTEIAPSMGWIAAFKDTENNIMGLHELAPQLKSRF